MTSPPRPKKSRLVRLARAAVVLLVVLAGAFLFRVPLFGGLIADYIADEASAALGLDVTVEGVAGSWYSDLVLLGVEATAPAGGEGAVRDLVCARLRVEYELSDLRDDPIGALRSLEADRLRVIARAPPTDPAPTADDAPVDLGELLAQVPTHVRVRVNGSVYVHNPDSGDVWVPRLAVEGHADDLAVRLEGALFPLLGETRMVEEYAFRVGVPDPRTVTFTSSDSVLGVGLGEFRLTIPPTVAWHAEASGTVAAGEFRLSVDPEEAAGTLRNVELSQLPPWIESLLPPETPLPERGAVRLDAVAHHDGDTWSSAEADARVDGLHWSGHELDRLTISARLADGEVTLGRVDALEGDDSVVLLGVRLDPDAPYGIAAAEGIEVATRDAAALAGRLARRAGQELDEGTLPRVPVAVAMKGTSPDGRRLDVQLLEIGTADTQVSVVAGVDASAGADDWREWPLTGSVHAQLSLAEFPQLLPTAWKLPDGRGQLTGTVAAGGTLGAPTCVLELRAGELTVLDENIRALDLSASFAWPRFDRLRVSLASSFATVEVGGSIDVETRTAALDPVLVQAPRLAALTEMFPALGPLEGTLELRGALTGSLDPPEQEDADWLAWVPKDLDGQLALTADDVSVDGRNLGEVRAGLRARGTALQIERASVRTDAVAASVRGALDLDARMLTCDELSVAVLDWSRLGAWAPLLADTRGESRLDGSVVVPLDAPADLRGELRLRSPSVALSPVTITDADIAVVAATPGVWRLDRMEGHVRVDVADRVLATQVRLTEPTRITRAEQGVTIDSAAFDALGGTLRLSGLVGDSIDARVVADALRLPQFVPADVQGAVTFDLAVRGSRDHIESLALELTVPDLRYAERGGRVRIEAVQDAGGVELRTLEVDAGDLARAQGTGRFPVRIDWEGPVLVESGVSTAELTVTSADPLRWVPGALPPELRVGGAQFVLRSRADAVELTGEITGVGWHRGEQRRLDMPEPIRIQVDAGPDGVTARVSCTGAGPVMLQGDCTSPHAFEWTSPWEWARDPTVVGLKGRVVAAVPSIGPVAPLVPGLVRADGALELALDLGGSLAEPQLVGTVAGTNLLVRWEGEVPTIDQGTLRIAVSREAIRIDECRARLGYAPIRVAGAITLPSDGPPVLAIDVHGKRALLARSQDLRLRSDLELRVEGPLDSALVKGEARITDALYSRALDLLGGPGGGPSAQEGLQLFSFRDPPLSDLRFDVHVVADETIRVDNNILRGRVAADLRIGGTGAVPIPRGRLRLVDTKVMLPLSRLDVQQGALEFTRESPFDPVLRVSATTRMKGYDLSVEVTGPASDAKVFVVSVPSMTQEDAILLLSTGATPEELEREGITSTALSSAGTVMGASLLRWFSGPVDPDAESVLDRVTLEVGRDVSRSGVATVDAEYHIEGRWYLAMSRDRYDEYNGGLVWRFRFR